MNYLAEFSEVFLPPRNIVFATNPQKQITQVPAHHRQNYSELIKEWVTPRQGRPKGLCSVYINPL
jgi:hypothetical protein